jgi:hypothetical protein
MRFEEPSRHSDFHPLKNPIYLVPPNSKRYIFRKKPTTKEFVDTIPQPCIVIKTSTDMVEFIQKYSKFIVIFDDVKQGVIDWAAVSKEFCGIEFKWYKPFYRANAQLKTIILEKDVLEFYSNLTEPCGFVFNS